MRNSHWYEGMAGRIVEKDATVLVPDAHEAIRMKASGRRRDPLVDWNARSTDAPGTGVLCQMVKEVASGAQANAIADG
ncbi:MAG: hypothetical protein IE912_04115 [Brevundimonas diminuta]|nr:hypothetical protein [Brevundimonas diminuta]MBD3818083.1 hypothetical protein [Brevundimonas diminuta]